MSADSRPNQTFYPDGRRARIRWLARGMKFNSRTRDGDYGDTNEVSGEIRINTKISLEDQAATLLHEYLHHICVVMNTPESEREDWVQAMEFNLRSLVRNNKDNFLWIVQNL